MAKTSIEALPLSELSIEEAVDAAAKMYAPHSVIA